MELTNDDIKARITAKFGELAYDWDTPYNMLTFTVQADHNLKVLQFLYDDEVLGFRFLTDLQAVHYPDNEGKELAVVYHLHNLVANVRIRMKIFVPSANPEVFSATALYAAANFMERETFDFYGVKFLGHPNLIRILNVDEMDYFPMRKEFPLEDQTRIDKDDEMFGRSDTLPQGAALQNGKES